MIRLILLSSGVLLLITHKYLAAISVQSQSIAFFLGIILLGVPHGAADLLVATKHSVEQNKQFSKVIFLSKYLFRLILFGIVLYFFPLVGNLLFMLFAAYHFGETDLHQFKTSTIAGIAFVTSYGLLILGVILLNHFEEVKPLLQLFDAGIRHGDFIQFLETNKYVILSFLGILFFASTFCYFYTSEIPDRNKERFLIQFALILFILYYLPMLLGFTFYFVVWHSVLSLGNIVKYLRKDGSVSLGLVIKQMLLYSTMAMAGIIIFGLTGFMFTNNNTIMVYVFLGLAVLTAPHMQVMQLMYQSIRTRTLVINNNEILPASKPA